MLTPFLLYFPDDTAGVCQVVYLRILGGIWCIHGCYKLYYVASGHYAKVVHGSTSGFESSQLELSKDMVKDQTYFFSLSQAQLRRLLFPLGCIPKIKFSEFVARHIGESEGMILEAESGDFLGKHRGFWFYTIGQRQGLRLPSGPRIVDCSGKRC